MKKKLAVLMMLLITLSMVMTGCGGSGGSDDDTIKIGLVQLVEHTSLDQIRESIIAQLEEDGYIDG